MISAYLSSAGTPRASAGPGFRYAQSGLQTDLPDRLTRELFAAALKRRIVEAVQSDLPCPVCFAKDSCFRQAQIQPISPPSRPGRGAYRDRHERGAGCGGRGSVGRETESQGEASRLVSDQPARGRTALQRLHQNFGRQHMAGRSVWRRLLRTAKPCGPGTRCWCQAGGGFSSPTGI